MKPYKCPAAKATKELVVGNRFKVLGKIGAGSFGDIYEGLDSRTNCKVAIKLEKAMNSNPMLKYEANIYKILTKGKRAPGICNILYSGNEGEFEVMVIELCGPSLEDLHNYCMRKLSVSSICMIADQVLHRLEYFHSKHFIHRDLKPENLVMGLGAKAHHIFMIDFGLAKRYRDPKTKQHIPHATGKPLIGTSRYASVNAHLGIEQARRDDLEGLSLVLVHFALSKLPWQGVKASTRAEKERRIMEKKVMTKPHTLCAGLPKCFESFASYIRDLKFEREPDYSLCRKMFHDEYKRINHRNYDWQFDWDAKYKQTRIQEPNLTVTAPSSNSGATGTTGLTDASGTKDNIG